MCVLVSKASPIGDQEVPDMIIRIEGHPPDFTDLDLAREFYKQQAGELFEALYGSLPGGTLAQLTALLLERHANNILFRIPST